MASIAGTMIRRIEGTVNTYWKFGAQIYDKFQCGLEGTTIHNVWTGTVEIAVSATTADVEIPGGVATTDVIIANANTSGMGDIRAERKDADEVTVTVATAPSGSAGQVSLIVIRV